MLLRPELDVWAPGEHNGTFRGNNLAFVTATAALDYWRDDALTRRVERNAVVMRAALDGLREQHPGRFVDVRGRGMIQGLVCAEPSLAGPDRGRGIPPATSSSRPAAARIEVVKLLPPLTIEEDDAVGGPGSSGGGGGGGRR